MNYTVDTLWVLLGHLIDDIQNHCIEYDSQITFTKKKFPYYIRFQGSLHCTFFSTVYYKKQLMTYMN